MKIDQFNINPIYNEYHKCIGLDIIDTEQESLLADNEYSNHVRIYVEDYDD